jgi:hypothetical protein
MTERDLKKLLEVPPAPPPRDIVLPVDLVNDFRSMVPGRVSQLIAGGDRFAVLHWEDFMILMERAGIDVRQTPTPSSDG